MILNRDRVFWTIALQTATVNFYLGGFGPAQPLLRSEQHTSLAVAGLHGTAMGIASILAGFAAPQLVHTFGRARTAWLGLAIFSIGVLGFVFAPPVQLTLLATLISGFGTSMVINSMVSQLSHHFSLQASQAISQAASIGSVGYILGTLTVGSIAGTSLSWRLGLIIVAPFALCLYLLNRSKINSEHVPARTGPQRGSLNRKFWFAWIGFVACISSEFATTFWSAALLRNRTGSSAAISTICIVAFGIGMGSGRWFGPRALRNFPLDNQIKAVMILQFLGFATLWSSHTLWISLLALFANGLGLAMQFAMLSVRLIGFSEGRPDLAIGKSSLGAGIAIAGAPFLLGLSGDHLGISRAYLMVPLLISISLAMIFLVPSEETAEEIIHEL
jgi:predicted MFS family arabinose efflux permease